MIVWPGLCAEVCADFTVDGDATGRDQLITMSARSDASGREKTVETQEKKLQGKKVTSLQRTAELNFVTFVTLLTIHFRAERVTRLASFSAGR